MNRDTLLGLYDRLVRLVEKLPGGIQKPILRELTPIREVFLGQRAPRLMLIGGSSQTVPELLHEISGTSVETGPSENGWRTYRLTAHAGQGEILILDARTETPLALVEGALAHLAPDLVLYLREGTEPVESLEAASARVAASGPDTPLLGLAFGDEAAQSRLTALLRADRHFSLRRHTVCLPGSGTATAEAICEMLPNETRLEFARITGAREAQQQIAQSLLKSFTTVCGVVGLQPIPLADMPILTSLQALMVGLVIYVSGKPVKTRLITEFLGALGLNIGAGILFRESARAIIKFVPFWGNAVSGFVAGAGTFAIGRAAISYFIEETPLTETRKLFQRLLPSWEAFKGRHLQRGKKDDALPKD